MGKTLEQAERVVAVADVIHHGEKLILPEGMSYEAARDLLKRREAYEEQTVEVAEKFEAFPWDGAYALDVVMRARFGWSPAVPTPPAHMFDSEHAPRIINLETGVGESTKVPWGRFVLPNIDGWLETNATKNKEGRFIFALEGQVKRKHEAALQEVFRDIRQYLMNHSLYRGKALKIRFRSDNGMVVNLPEPEFMDTSDIHRNQLVYSRSVEAALDTNLFTPISRVRDLIANGIPVKRGILLAGPYGTGKTLAAKVASRLATENGLTFIYIERADELADAVDFARMYQTPDTAAVIFCEDIDRALDGERDAAMDDILNIIDGIDTKSANIITVLTTNNLENIHPAMLRPGRLDAVIDVAPPDAEAVTRLIRLYGGETIAPDADLSSVGETLAGTIPAVIAEVVKRAKLAQLSRQAPGTFVTEITPEALLESAETIKAQIALLADKPKEETPTLDQAMKKAVQDVLLNAYADYEDGSIRLMN